MIRGTYSLIVALSVCLPASAGAQAPLQDRFFDSEGVRIRYVDTGRGEPLVLVHGNLSHIERQWVATGVLPALARTHRVIALDLRGFGKSQKPHDPAAYGLHMGRDVIRLLDHLGLRRAHIVGYSMGGNIVAQLLTTHPDRFITATIGGASGQRRLAANAERAAEARAAEYEQGMLRSMLTALSPPDEPPSDEAIRQWSEERLAGQDRAALVALTRNFRGFLISDSAIAAVKVPAMAIVGSKDPAVTDVQELKALMPDLRVVIVEGATHTGATGAPFRPEFAEAVAAFARTSGAR